MFPATVSVIVCAFSDERWEVLIRAIDSVAAQPGDPEVVLVIDNNPSLLERARERWPHLLVMPNAGPRGLSHARNTAIARATGELLVFLDDDAAGREGWLAALVAPFADPAVLATGGVARPLWPAKAPAVIPDELGWIVGCSFAGQAQGTDIRNVMGCNMAFRAAPLRAIGGFETSLGRVGRLPLGAEETDACIRLRAANPTSRIAFAAGAVVDHTVTPERARWGYVIERSYAEGISKAAMARRLGGAALSTESDYVRKVLPRALWRELRQGRIAGAAALIGSLGAAGVGYIRGRVRKVVA